ncbi:Predicted nucleotide-utilizing enzyme [Desulfacinum hydrothermale DSM 13146]|uniref:Predicted nucleotide-utilizing enzyme n=1 Tax=Desulfacinum hydrothermale DSM 13146 TaxID=1121390 RepID=A0A1W1XAG9_9BACT|nr:molybdopterin-binding protein [Desulfacinum hydrothermale]SMC20840.1 Predicted nucleotide-utilizing enzyme [Desulfacinum hydrothermale DSM 13146]
MERKGETAQVHPAAVTVGDELIYGERANDNLVWMLGAFAQKGRAARVGLVLPDREEVIAFHVRSLLEQGCRPVFISGGIGGTHDDRTRQGVALALNRPLELHGECDALLAQRYRERYTDQRRRMAWLPRGASLIPNATGAPGFCVDSVYAFPGFPSMLKPMATAVLDALWGPLEGSFWETKEIRLPVPEGTVAAQVEAFARKHPQVLVGIYPGITPAGPVTSIRCRFGKDDAASRRCVETLLSDLQHRFGGKEPQDN